jgi:hypothetical protein
VLALQSLERPANGSIETDNARSLGVPTATFRYRCALALRRIRR